MFGFRKFLKGINIIPKTTSTVNSAGDLDFDTTNNKLNLHNGTSSSPVVSEAHAATLTNKTIDADSNTISNIDNNEIKALAGIDATKIADGSVTNTEFQYVDATSSIQTQLNGKQATGNYITALTGDVTATGPGSVASTVVSVGGSSAANVASAEALANAATDVNTISTIVKRDSSGDFAAGTITADLLGNASTATTSANTTATSNSTITTLSALSLPGTQVTGDISGNSANVTGTVAIANGGTGQTTKAAAFDALSPMTTGGDIIYGGASGTGTRLPNGTSGQFLKSNGTTLAPSWANPSIVLSPPTQQIFTSGSGTYTTPASVLYIRVRMVGAGAGGGAGANGTNSPSSGSTGSSSTFGTSLLAANGGFPGTMGANQSPGGAGGTASILSPAYGTAITGGWGSPGTAFNNVSTSLTVSGGNGGVSAFGGAGAGGDMGNVGVNAIANSGSGGGGAGSSGTPGQTPGSGGGAGGFVDAIIPSPSATYSFVVGVGGAGGSAVGVAGGNGADGYIEVTEYYQ